MKPAPFSYVRADTADEVLTTLREHGAEARILAGGQSLLPMLSMRLAKPAVLIDVMRVGALAAIAVEKDAIVIQAAVRQATVLGRESLRDELPLLASALPWVISHSRSSRWRGGTRRAPSSGIVANGS